MSVRSRAVVAALQSFRDDLARGLRDEWHWLAARALQHRLVLAAGAALTAGALLAAAVAPAEPASPLRSLAPQTVAATSSIAGVPGDREPGRAGVERSALLMARGVGVPVDGADWRGYLGDVNATTARWCAPSRLEVSWLRPGPGYELGGHVEPIGPPPDENTTRVNGIVLCRGSHFAYLGFEASYEDGRWWVSAVPSLPAEETVDLLPGEDAQVGAQPAAPGAQPDQQAGLLPDAKAWDGSLPEPLAPHVPQTTCDPTAKPGVLGFRDMLLSAFPTTRNLGIGRVCDAPGVSEHKEGRAFDWGVRTADPTEAAAAGTVISWLLDSDRDGNPYAMARRTGLMYVIWNGQIWSAERAAEGWRPYVGVSDHTDHVHFSFSWAGALAQTSFWTGEQRGRLRNNAPDLPLLPRTPVGGLPTPGALLPPAGGPAPAGSGSPWGPTPSNEPSSTSSDQSPPQTTTTTSTTAPPTTTTTSTTTTTTTIAPSAPVTSPTLPVGGLTTFGG